MRAMERKRRIGILGGTFDPIHEAHLKLGRQARDVFQLDQVIFMPTGNSYKKETRYSVSDAYHRGEMVKRAIADEAYFGYSDQEIRRQGPTYTADTLREFSCEHANADVYFILGADSLQDIESWYLPEVIFSHAAIIVANRNHQVPEEKLQVEIRHLQERFGARIYLLNFESMDISSSKIRRHLEQGGMAAASVPAAVKEYIYDHDLYREDEVEPDE